MVSNTQPTPRGSVSDLVNNLLDRGYNQTVEPVLNAIQRSTNSGIIAQRLTELDAEAQRLAEAGDRLRPDNPVLRALLADMEATLVGNAQLVNGVSENLQSTAISAAGNIQRQLALPGVTDAQLARIGLVWNRPDPEAVARLVNYANSPTFAATLQAYPQQILDVVRNQAIRGIAQGWSPRRTAREIRRTTQGLPRHVANNLARTLQLTAYRDATAAHQQANLDICQQIIRIAALDQRTCLSCIALHGTVIWDSERDGGSAPVPRVDDHHSGRCTSVMRVKGRELNIQSGPEWFDNLPPDRQRMQASFLQSPSKWDAFQSGKITWPDFVHAYQDPAFGQMLREASLSDALARPRAPQTQGGQIVTPDGLMPPDIGTPGFSLSELERFLETSNGPLANAISDWDMQLIGYDANANFTINAANVNEAAKAFVRESMDFQYGRDYIVGLVTERAQQNIPQLVDINGEKLYNDYMATRAQAIQVAAQIGNVRLTEPQQRRLNRARNGEWLDMVYTTESSERGSLANRALRRTGGGLSGAELKQARQNFLNWVQGIDT